MNQRARSSVAIDWTMGVFSALIMAGVYQDGWAHGHGLVDQSFMTPWHAILYGTMALTGLFLLGLGVTNLSRRYRFRNALPYGYWMSAIGVVVFLLGGVFDLWWHTLFGIEVNLQGLVSVSHLVLAFGGALVFCGTLRAVAYQYGRDEHRWSRVGPAVLASLAVLMLLGFFTQYAAPFNDDTPMHILQKAPAETGGVVYSVRSDGRQETRLAMIAGYDAYGVTVSPDGKRVAYRVQQNNGDSAAPSDLYVANIDGGGVRRITHSGRHDTQPAWSPDGTRIAFLSMPADTSGTFRLQTVRPDGSDIRTIVDQSVTISSPAWSPDSRSIAVASRNGVTYEIAVVPADGGTMRWLPATAGGGFPSWSKTGAIAFSKDNDVAVTGPGGNSARTLISNATSARWSSDGKAIAFVRTVDGSAQVFTARADGSQQRNVSQLASMDADSVALGGGRVFFTASGRPRPLHTPIGDTYALDAAIVSSIVLMGVVLLMVRRWRMPPGALFVLLSLFAVACATQSDLYFLIPVNIAVALAADIYVSVLGERARSGTWFYALAALMPALTFALFEYAVSIHSGGLGWAANLLLGAPFICGFAGLLLGFCFDAPLRTAAAAPELRLREPADLVQDLVSRIPTSHQ